MRKSTWKVQIFNGPPVAKPPISRTALESPTKSQNFYGDCKVNQNRLERELQEGFSS